jgi:DNA-binding Lrp family transcriptional regulator
MLYRSGLSNCGARVDEVMACYLMTGDTDYLIRIAVTDMGRWKNSSLSSSRRFPALKKYVRVFHSSRSDEKPHCPCLRRDGCVPGA